MRLKVSELLEPVTHSIKGDELWLSDLYKVFQPQSEKPLNASKVSAQLTVTPIPSEPAVIVRVHGTILYDPYVDCARCADPILWPVRAEIDVYYEPPEAKIEKACTRPNINLREDDLNRYFYDNDEIDIEALLNDTIQTHIPSQTILRSTDGDQCLVCSVDLRRQLVYGEPANDASPFAILKQM